jgi:hypothetical protein
MARYQKEKKRKEEVRIVAIPNDNLDSLCFLGPTLPLRPSLTSPPHKVIEKSLVQQQ